MSEKDKRNIKSIVDEINNEKEVKRKGVFTNFTVWSLHI
jgi:hypothetical protein